MALLKGTRGDKMMCVRPNVRPPRCGPGYGAAGLATILSLLLTLLVVAPAQAGLEPRPPFVPIGGTFSGRIGLAVADLNGDGKADAAVTCTQSNRVEVALSNGDGTFRLGDGVSMFPLSNGFVAVADVNGDNKPDTITTTTVLKISVALGNGDGSFQVQQTYDVDDVPGEIAIADLNGDGKLDLAVTGQGPDATPGSTVSVLLGVGDGTFPTHVSYPVGVLPTTVAAADVNGDGKVDLVAGNSTDRTISILPGNGNGTFQPQQTIALTARPVFVKVADLNGDGRPDLVAAHSNNRRQVSVLLGNGNGTFQAETSYDVGAVPSSVAVADLNADGKPDLAVSNAGTVLTITNTVSVLLGNGDGTFQPQVPVTVGTSPAWVATGDVNADARPDLVVVLPEGGAVQPLLGTPNGTLQFSSPSVSTTEGGTATVTVSRNGNPTGAVSAVVSLTGGSAVQGIDFTYPAPQTLTWSDNDGAPRTVSVPTTQNATDDPDKTVQLTVALPPGPSWVSLGAQTATAVTIVDDEAPPVISVDPVSVAEGNSGESQMRLPVSLSGSPTSQTITVQYATANGTAEAGTDYTATNGTLTFAPGETSKSIVVPILGDTVVEPNEGLTVTLSNPTNATLGSAQAVGTILNDDAGSGEPPIPSCVPRPSIVSNVTAGGGALQVRVQSATAGLALRQIRFGTFQNAIVTMNGQAITSGQTVTLPAGTASAELQVRRLAAGQSTTVPFTVVDGCGEWPTFVGGGAGASF